MEIIIGVGVSLIVQGIKNWFGTSQMGTLASVLILSLVGAAIYYYVADTQYWRDLLEIGAIAGAFYTYIIARFEK